MYSFYSNNLSSNPLDLAQEKINACLANDNAQELDELLDALRHKNHRLNEFMFNKLKDDAAVAVSKNDQSHLLDIILNKLNLLILIIDREAEKKEKELVSKGKCILVMINPAKNKEELNKLHNSTLASAKIGFRNDDNVYCEQMIYSPLNASKKKRCRNSEKDFLGSVKAAYLKKKETLGNETEYQYAHLRIEEKHEVLNRIIAQCRDLSLQQFINPIDPEKSREALLDAFAKNHIKTCKLWMESGNHYKLFSGVEFSGKEIDMLHYIYAAYASRGNVNALKSLENKHPHVIDHYTFLKSFCWAAENKQSECIEYLATKINFESLYLPTVINFLFCQHSLHLSWEHKANILDALRNRIDVNTLKFLYITLLDQLKTRVDATCIKLICHLLKYSELNPHSCNLEMPARVLTFAIGENSPGLLALFIIKLNLSGADVMNEFHKKVATARYNPIYKYLFLAFSFNFDHMQNKNNILDDIARLIIHDNIPLAFITLIQSLTQHRGTEGVNSYTMQVKNFLLNDEIIKLFNVKSWNIILGSLREINNEELQQLLLLDKVQYAQTSNKKIKLIVETQKKEISETPVTNNKIFFWNNTDDTCVNSSLLMPDMDSSTISNDGLFAEANTSDNTDDGFNFSPKM